MSVEAAHHNARFTLATPTTPGAIALIQLHGTQCAHVLQALTNVRDWPVGCLRFVRFGDIDEGLAGCITDEMAQIMPHGGLRVLQRLQQQLREFGVEHMGSQDLSGALYPEAADKYEMIMLEALSCAASPLAIEPLLSQPAHWRSGVAFTNEDRVRSLTLNRLLTPPTIVVAGSPNVGKSTLSNALLGRNMSITLDMPGTTRDYTVAQIDLAGLVVTWHDTPGLRVTDDPIEARAIALATALIARADLLIAMTDTEHDWPQLPREPDLRIANKADIAQRGDANLNISAATGEGIRQLVSLVRDTLVPPEDLKAAHERPWLFDARLLEK